MSGSWDPPSRTAADGIANVRQRPPRRASRPVEDATGPWLANPPLSAGFAGLFKVDTAKYRAPILAAATDGVGVKQAIAGQLGVYHTVGVDVVAMVADDVVACGAEPLFLLTQLRIGQMRTDDVSSIMAGVTNGCDIIGCQLIESAVAHSPGVGRDDDFDLSATGIGIVEADDLLGRHRINAGDLLIAMASSGLHANGFGIVRSAVLGHGRARLDSVVDDIDGERTLGEVLLTPTRIYAPAVRELVAAGAVCALAHITGGGIPGNVSRILPEFADARVDRGTWMPQPVFGYIAANGRISAADMERSFNMGVGMIAVVPPDEADQTVATLTGLGQEAWVVGEIVPGDGRVRMVGTYRQP